MLLGNSISVSEIYLQDFKVSNPKPAPKSNPAPEILNDEISLSSTSLDGDTILISVVAPPVPTSFTSSFYPPGYNANNSYDPCCALRSMCGPYPDADQPWGNNNTCKLVAALLFLIII